MKRLLTLITAVLLAVTELYAQNANRNGFFIELQGGAAFGEVLKYESEHMSIPDVSRLKGGGIGSMDFGYRIATSNHFAIDLKIGAWADLADFKNTYQLRALPGIRWTSNDFSSMSAYIAFNAGIGLYPTETYYGFCVPIEISTGLNFTQHFYGGIMFNYSIAGHYKRDSYQFNFENSWDEVNVSGVSYPSLGIRLGYRF